MTYINIFLASSLEELRLERETLGNYVRKLNDVYVERGIYIRLFECEYENAAMAVKRKQDEYNDQIRDSQLFFVLFYTEAGQYTQEEFNVAYEQFKKTGAPAILTCFKQGEDQPKQSVLDFMQRLDKELGHYFTKYTDIDTLKLKLLDQIILMNLDVPIKLENSVVTLDGKNVLTLENIPMWANNENFQTLKAQCRECERAYLDAKAKTTDPFTDSAFLQASERWKEAKKVLQEWEQQLFSMALEMEEKNNNNALTERQRKAYELLEQGDSEGANKILDMREILDDVEHARKLKNLAQNKLEKYVGDMLLKIETLKIQVDKPERFAEIREIFEIAVEVELQDGLKPIATRKYIEELQFEEEYDKAIPIGEKYWNYIKHLSDVKPEVDKVEILKAELLLARLYMRGGKRDKKLSRLIEDVQEDCNELRIEDLNKHRNELIEGCLVISEWHRMCGQNQAAEKICLYAEELNKSTRELDKHKYFELHIYLERLLMQKTEREKLIQCDDLYLPYLMETYWNLGITYRDIKNVNRENIGQNIKKQEKLNFLCALKVCRELVQRDTAYLEMLLKTTMGAFLYDIIDWNNKIGITPYAKQEISRSLELYESLGGEKNELYERLKEFISLLHH